MFPAERIIALREEIGLTQKELSNKVFISNSVISEYENNKIQPSVSALIQLANFFHVSIDYLLGQTEIKSSMKDLEQQLITRSGKVPIDDIFKLNDNEKEIVGLIIQSYTDRKAAKIDGTK